MTTVISILVGLAIVVGLLAIAAGMVWYVHRTWQNRESASRIAGLVGFQNLTPGRSLSQSWYGGVAQGRRVAIAIASIRNRAASADSVRHELHLRIVMEVVVPRPLGVIAFRSHDDRSSLHRFEEAFSTKNCQELGDQSRREMIAFVAKGYPTGLRGATYRTTPGTRNLRLRDRAGSPDGLLDPAVLPDARAILVHDHPHPEIGADTFGQLLYEMAVVAYAVEQGR